MSESSMLVKEHLLSFFRPAGTSRGVLKDKKSWYIFLNQGKYTGIGEVGPIPGLSPDAPEQVEKFLHKLIKSGALPGVAQVPAGMPAVRFGLETALKDLKTGGQRILFPSDFTRGETGIPINGLIWMGPVDAMKKQVKEKIESGYRVIKIKVGALDFDAEVELLRYIRKEFATDNPQLRLDANGAFSPHEALEKLKILSQFDIHSIEQPIAAGQREELARITGFSPIPVVLDEELIGIVETAQMDALISEVRPAFIILKPSLAGGFEVCSRWIEIAGKYGVGWWVTSALESNIGLNALAQWTAILGNPLHQGLGTGMLYRNNIPSPLEIRGDQLFYNPARAWNLELLK